MSTEATPDIRVGDIVTRSAKGKRFTVTDFWTPAYKGAEQFAGLTPVEGYTKASAPVSQLTLVERPEVTA